MGLLETIHCFAWPIPTPKDNLSAALADLRSDRVRWPIMRIGIFADSHDHLDHIRRAVEVFNVEACQLVIFAGDLVSSFAVPPLRDLKCRTVACFGDNEGNKPGVAAGFRILGCIGEPPFCLKTADGTRILVTHMLRHVRELDGEFDVCIYAHTHKPEIWKDERGRLHVNPGETSGWTYRRPTVAILETEPLEARIVELSGQPACTRSPPAGFSEPAPQNGV